MEEGKTNVRGAERRLERAREALKVAMSRLASVRRAALRGNHDAEALDVAVLACREAQATVRAAREDLEREWMSALDRSIPAASAPEPGRANADAASDPEPLQITPRLLFARWLVQTGRLTDAVSGDVVHIAVEPELQPAA
ncbi:MAG TPA: hypothetical protein VFX49_03825 [Chloroflexota bacterium]|nr:hypothetical protein [Chloroflexota bacterium]